MTQQAGLDYEELAQNMDEMREVVRAMVVGLMSDGFLEVEARAIVAGIFASNIPKDPNKEGSA